AAGSMTERPHDEEDQPEQYPGSDDSDRDRQHEQHDERVPTLIGGGADRRGPAGEQPDAARQSASHAGSSGSLRLGLEGGWSRRRGRCRHDLRRLGGGGRWLGGRRCGGFGLGWRRWGGWGPRRWRGGLGTWRGRQGP